MRAVSRRELPSRVQSYLDKRQLRVELDSNQDSFDIEAQWASARKASAIGGERNSVLSVLKKMAGPTERCMYCLDSHGCEIEHFRPKQYYPLHAFRWLNMLLICGECNRRKGTQFPLNDLGEPELIDPTVDNPWDYLDFNPETGFFTPLFDESALGGESVKGRQTLNVLCFSRREVLSRVYKRCFSNLCRAVKQFLVEHANSAATSGDVEHLCGHLLDLDEQGLLPWCLGSAGKTETPFSELHANFPTVWHALAERIQPAP